MLNVVSFSSVVKTVSGPKLGAIKKSGAYDEFCSSTILGAAAETAHKESYQRML